MESKGGHSMKYGLTHIELSPSTTGPEPVTVDEAKTALRVNADDEDSYIEDILIPAARQHAELIQNSAIVRGTWELSLDRFPSGSIVIPLQPVLSVDEIRYFDSNGTEQILNPASYTIDTRSFRARIDCESWPETERRLNAVTVQFEAGYNVVPANIKQAILLLVAHWFEHREAVASSTVASEIEFAVTALLNLERSVQI